MLIPLRLCLKCKFRMYMSRLEYGAEVAEPAEIAHDIVQHHPAGRALTDVKRRVGRSARDGMFEQPVAGSERIDSIVAVVVGGEQRLSKCLHSRPEESVEREVSRSHVLDRHSVAADHDAVAALELTVQNSRVPGPRRAR